MAEQVIIEFIGDTSGLTDAANQLNQLGGKEADNLNKTNQAYKSHAEEKKKVIELEKKRQQELDKTITKLAKETGQSKKSLQDFANTMTGVVGAAIADVTGEMNQYADGMVKTTNAMKEQTKEGQSLKARLKEIKAELSGMETGDIAFDPKRFKELSKEGGVLADAIGDVSARVNVLASDTQGLDALISTAQGITGAFSVAQGAAALFGEENENVQEALLKVQSAMAILNGLQALQATLNKDSAFSVTVLGGAQTAYNAVIGTSTGLLKVLRLAFAATGIGAIILLVGALVANWDKLSASFSKSLKPLKDFSDSLGGVSGIFSGVVESLKQGFGQIGEILKAVANRDFKQVVNLAKGLGTAFVVGFNKGVSDEKAAQAEVIRMEEIKERIKTNERVLRVQEAAGKNTIALERKILQDKIAVQKEGTDEYKDAVNDLAVFEAKILNQKKENHKEEKDSYIRSIQEQTDKYNEFLKKRGEDKSRAIEIEILQEKLGANDRLRLLDLERQAKKQNIDNTITDLELANLKKLEIDKEYYDALAANELEWGKNQKAKEDERLKKTEEINAQRIKDEQALQSQIFNLTVQTFQSALGSLSEISRINTEEKLSTLEAQREAELANTELTESQKLAINKKYDREAKIIKRKAAEEEKALKIMQAIIGTAAAIVNALASGGPAAIALAAAAGVAGAAQIAVIARTPIPKFAKGSEYVQRGSNRSGIDTIPAMINEGERIVPTDINRKLKGIPNSMLPELVANYTQRMPSLEYLNTTSIQTEKGIDYNKLGSILAEKLKANPQAVVKIDKAGFSTFIQSRNQQTEYLNAKFNA